MFPSIRRCRKGRASVFPRRFLSLALLATALPVAAWAEPALLPAPVSAVAGSGRLLVGPGTAIIVPAGDTAARNAAERLAEWTLAARGLKLSIATRATGPAIRFRRGASGAAESYALDIGPRGATITAGDDAGLLYGAVSLWQYLTPDRARGAVAIPAVSVKDAPRFRWRGLMLDSARHFQSPEYVRHLIDWMAVNKLNTLHWHLVDDQGWRLEIRKYPRLTKVSGWRVPATAPGAPPLPRTGGFYTQAEVREIVAYAAARNVTIVPEIEMPGHALSAIRAYPALGTGAPVTPGAESDWGVFPWLYNVDDATFGFLEEVLTEVMALFPSRYIHVGGDEAVVGVFSRGDCLAEAPCLAGGNYPVSGETVTEARLLAVPARRIIELNRSSPEIGLAMLASASLHLKRLVDQIEELKARTGPQRLADFLVGLAPVAQGPCTIALPYAKLLIAARLGIKPESLSRAFQRLRAVGVRINQNTVAVGDVARLTEFAGRERLMAFKCPAFRAGCGSR